MKVVQLVALVLVVAGASAAACGSSNNVARDRGGAGGEGGSDPPRDIGSSGSSQANGARSGDQAGAGAATSGAAGDAAVGGNSSAGSQDGSGGMAGNGDTENLGGRGGDSGCSLGDATSLATGNSLDLFGTPSYFENGEPLPAGRYRVRYLDGCMKYDSAQAWTVNHSPGGRFSFYVIGSTTSEHLAVPPGPPSGYLLFADCEAAGRLVEPVEFELEVAQPVGIWLQDEPYSDNVAGEDGRNPRWALDAVRTGCNGG